MMTFTTIETLHQIKYLQPFAMNILSFILPSLSFYFMSLTTILNLLNFLMKTFLRNKRNKKIKNNKRHMSLKFLLDKIINLEDLNL